MRSSPGRFRSSRRRGKETSSNDDQDEFTASTSGREASTTSTREVRGAWRRGNVQEEDDIAEDDDFAEELGKPIVIPLTRGEADFVLPLAPIGPQASS